MSAWTAAEFLSRKVRWLQAYLTDSAPIHLNHSPANPGVYIVPIPKGTPTVNLPLNPQAMLAFVEIAGSSLLPAYVAAERKANPTVTDAQLTVIVDGDLKHYTRGKLGFFGFAVDIIWPEPAFQDLLQPLIQQAIAQAEAPPPSPAPPV